jgi:hypothetical protein
VPFVQGQISGDKASATVETECGHCHQPLHIEIDSELEFHVVEEGAEPLVYVPLLDVRNLDEPSIIDSF